MTMPRGHEPSSAFHEVTASLLWPKLLRAAPLALRPARVLMAFFLIVTVAILIHVADLWLLRGGPKADTRTLATIVHDQLTVVGGRFSARQFPQALAGLIEVPVRMFLEHPALTMLLVLPVAAVWGVLGGAIGRTTATEFGLVQRTHWGVGIVLSLRRWASQALTLILPLAFAGTLAGLLAVLGKFLLGFAVTSLLGGVLFGAGVLVSLVIVLTLAIFVLALPMLVPAVLIEGTDSIDAIQRCAAYVVAKPLRYLVYCTILFVQLLVVTAILTALIRGSFFVAGSLNSIFLHEPYDALVRQQAFFGEGPNIGLEAGVYTPWQERAGSLIGFWRRLFQIIPAAYAVSYFFTAGSVLYLMMRRACDGQDAAELWSPEQDMAGPIGARLREGDDKDES